ncbi:hypothetical protein Tco_0909123 [Tanacetum coccineum]|uniref:Uncharacterized protein n=1 Tax=Tanacetum coccineum TaxID=301880 RepID=A0ABQ5CR91_9ASTR
MFKLDIELISHRLKNNRDAHEDYLKKTIEYTDTIHGLVERARKQNPSEPLLDSACRCLAWKSLLDLGPVSVCDRLVSRAKVIENQVMAISVISVSSDSSEESVGIPVGRVILFGTIPTTIPDTTPIISPPTTHTDTTVKPTEIPTILPTFLPTVPPSPDHTPALPDITPALPDYSPASNTESDPSKDPSSNHIPPLPAISPFLSSADDTTNSDTPDTPPSPTHDSSLEASSDFHSDASSDSSSRYSLPYHSSPDLPSTFAGPSCKRHRSAMTSVPELSPASEALSPVRADLIPSPKRVRDFDYLADLEVDSRESSEPSKSRGTDVGVDDDIKRVDESHSEHEIDLVQATIKACFDFADIIKSKGINVRVVAETVARDEIRADMRDIVEGGDDRVTYPVVSEDVQEVAPEERAVEVTALTERIAELKRDNRRLRGTTSVKGQRVDRLQRGMSRMKMPNTRFGASTTYEEIKDLVSGRVAEEMEAREAAMNLEPLNENEDEQKGKNGGNRNGENRGNGNGGNGGDGNGENGNGNGGN